MGCVSIAGQVAEVPPRRVSGLSRRRPAAGGRPRPPRPPGRRAAARSPFTTNELTCGHLGEALAVARGERRPRPRPPCGPRPPPPRRPRPRGAPRTASLGPWEVQFLVRSRAPAGVAKAGDQPVLGMAEPLAEQQALGFVRGVVQPVRVVLAEELVVGRRARSPPGVGAILPITSSGDSGSSHSSGSRTPQARRAARPGTVSTRAWNVPLRLAGARRRASPSTRARRSPRRRPTPPSKPAWRIAAMAPIDVPSVITRWWPTRRASCTTASMSYISAPP